MTITELIPLVKQLSASDKVKLIRILAEELDSDSDDIYPLEPDKTYTLPVEILRKAVEAANETPIWVWN